MGFFGGRGKGFKRVEENRYMNKQLLKILCCFMVLLQFVGCATTFPPQNKYQQQKDEAPQIVMPINDIITPKIFDIKLDEIRQKSNRYLPAGSIKDSVLQCAKQLQLVTDEHYRRIKKATQRSAVIGAVVGSACCIAYATNAYNKEENSITAAFIPPAYAMLTIISALVGSLVGSFAGSLIMVGKVNKPISQQNTNKMRELINSYNTFVISPAINDTCQ